MVFKELPLSALHIHADHIANPTLDNLEGDQLLLSVQIHGVLQALLVTDEYLIIDGARRYLCAKKLGLPTVPCIVRPSLDDGDYQLLHLVLHNTHEPLTQAEYAECVKRIKKLVEATGD
jgi:ParB-like chromosome segregation protein Spo0J